MNHRNGRVQRVDGDCRACCAVSCEIEADTAEHQQPCHRRCCHNASGATQRKALFHMIHPDVTDHTAFSANRYRDAAAPARLAWPGSSVCTAAATRRGDGSLQIRRPWRRSHRPRSCGTRPTAPGCASRASPRTRRSGGWSVRGRNKGGHRRRAAQSPCAIVTRSRVSPARSSASAGGSGMVRPSRWIARRVTSSPT